MTRFKWLGLKYALLEEKEEEKAVWLGYFMEERGDSTLKVVSSFTSGS
jgi:hypothetical protein